MKLKMWQAFDSEKKADKCGMQREKEGYMCMWLKPGDHTSLNEYMPKDKWIVCAYKA